MVLTQVKSEDKERVFGILSKNGRFIGLSENRFSILENSNEVLTKLNNVGIAYTILNSVSFCSQSLSFLRMAKQAYL